MSPTTAPRPALLVTADAALTDSVSRLAAAAGVRLAVVDGARDALPAWGHAAAVLVGPDRAADLAAAAVPRRGEVHVVAAGHAPDGVYREALRLGATTVVELPAGSTWLLQTLADLAEEAAGPGRSVAVVGASGGAGASVLAAALATVASVDADVLLLDLDPLGAGQRLLVGHEEGPGVSWRDLELSSGRLGAGALHDAVPRRDRLGVLGWSGEGRVGADHRVAPGLATEAVAAGVRGHDWVVLDVPRRAEDDVRSLLSRCDHVVVVAHARATGLSAAARSVPSTRAAAPAAGLVLRTQRAAPPLSRVARVLGLEPWAELRDDGRLDEHVALGLGVVPSGRGQLARAAVQVLERCTADRRRAAA